MSCYIINLVTQQRCVWTIRGRLFFPTGWVLPKDVQGPTLGPFVGVLLCTTSVVRTLLLQVFATGRFESRVVLRLFAHVFCTSFCFVVCRVRSLEWVKQLLVVSLYVLHLVLPAASPVSLLA